MLLNKIPVLDNGYVALISSTLSGQLYQETVDEFMGARDNKRLNKVCYAVLAFKAPIFVQLYLAQHGLTLVSALENSEITAYKPNPGEIGCTDHADNKNIADDISRTTDTLLLNPKAYQADGADSFMSQLIMPISTYATFLVSGSLETWQSFYQRKTVPNAIKSYVNAVEHIIRAEWKHVQ